MARPYWRQFDTVAGDVRFVAGDILLPLWTKLNEALA